MSDYIPRSVKTDGSVDGYIPRLEAIAKRSDENLALVAQIVGAEEGLEAAVQQEPVSEMEKLERLICTLESMSRRTQMQLDRTLVLFRG